jgi:DNA-binding XRE family transcriptional regulator
MNKEKQRRLEKAGFQVGSVSDFLGMNEEETAYLEVKLALANTLIKVRKKRKYTQIELAERIHSSQSRVAKMESGDPSVSLDLLIHTLFALGCTSRDLGRILQAA